MMFILLSTHEHARISLGHLQFDYAMLARSGSVPACIADAIAALSVVLFEIEGRAAS